MTLPGSSKSDWQLRSEAPALAGGIGSARVPVSTREGHNPPLRAESGAPGLRLTLPYRGAEYGMLP